MGSQPPCQIGNPMVTPNNGQADQKPGLWPLAFTRGPRVDFPHRGKSAAILPQFPMGVTNLAARVRGH